MLTNQYNSVIDYIIESGKKLSEAEGTKQQPEGLLEKTVIDFHYISALEALERLCEISLDEVAKYVALKHDAR